MKKFYTFIVAAMLSLAGAAQTTQYFISYNNFAWDLTYDRYEKENVVLKLNGVGSRFSIIGEDNAIDLSQYKGIKVEYSTSSTTYVFVEQDDVKYKEELPKDQTEYTMLFNDDVLDLETLTNLTVGADAISQSMVFNKAYLIKNDGTEESVAVNGNYRNISLGYSSMDVTFTGFNARLGIWTNQAKDVAINTANEEYVYKVEFEEPTTGKLYFKRQGFLGDVQTVEIPAGATSATLVPADGASNYLYIYTEKAPSDDAVFVPFTVKVKGIYRMDKGAETGVEKIEKVTTDDVRYNLSGQKVGKDYKGIVIMNGKKYAF